MTAKEFLRKIKKLDKLIENKMAELQHWKEIATNSTVNMSGERVQSSGRHDMVENAICTYIDLDREIARCIDELIDKKKDVISVIEQLSATEYDVLHKVYVQYYTFDEVAIACKRSHSWATTVHGRALKHVQTILNKREETL